MFISYHIINQIIHPYCIMCPIIHTYIYIYLIVHAYHTKMRFSMSIKISGYPIRYNPIHPILCWDMLSSHLNPPHILVGSPLIGPLPIPLAHMVLKTSKSLGCPAWPTSSTSMLLSWWPSSLFYAFSFERSSSSNCASCFGIDSSLLKMARWLRS